MCVSATRLRPLSLRLAFRASSPSVEALVNRWGQAAGRARWPCCRTRQPSPAPQTPALVRRRPGRLPRPGLPGSSHPEAWRVVSGDVWSQQTHRRALVGVPWQPAPGTGMSGTGRPPPPGPRGPSGEASRAGARSPAHLPCSSPSARFSGAGLGRAPRGHVPSRLAGQCVLTVRDAHTPGEGPGHTSGRGRGSGPPRMAHGPCPAVRSARSRRWPSGGGRPQPVPGWRGAARKVLGDSNTRISASTGKARGTKSAPRNTHVPVRAPLTSLSPAAAALACPGPGPRSAAVGPPARARLLLEADVVGVRPPRGNGSCPDVSRPLGTRILGTRLRESEPSRGYFRARERERGSFVCAHFIC